MGIYLKLTKKSIQSNITSDRCDVTSDVTSDRCDRDFSAQRLTLKFTIGNSFKLQTLSSVFAILLQLFKNETCIAPALMK